MIRITHHIEFDFKDRDASDLEKLNRILASLKLEKLELKNSRGYLAVTQDGDGNLLEMRYGLDSGTLICTPSKTGNYYRIDTAVADRSVDYDEFLEIWRANNPNRAMRTVITMEYETDYAYIVLHHPRT
ncbi:MAG: hypothetical protein IKA47_00280 [Oscillospiraceae bacterium]|nr:hypothetical protein [Oscillospiraceae bacterium]